MSQKANYFKIGLFFTLSIVLIVTAIIVWGAELLTKDKIYIETYFNRPVTGLNVGSSLEIMGVKIGQVEDVGFVSAVYDISSDPTIVSRCECYVRVLCSLSAKGAKERAGDITAEQMAARVSNLMQKGLRLRLGSNILTEQAHLEGVFVDPNQFPVLDITWTPKHMYIASVPDELSILKNSATQIMGKLDKIEFQKIMDNLNQLLVTAMGTLKDANVPGVTDEMKGLFTELRGTNHRVKELVQEANVPGLTDEMQRLFVELRETNRQILRLLTPPSLNPRAQSVNLPQIMLRLDRILERFDRETSNKKVDIDKFVRNMRVISDDLRELTAMLKKNPSELIFSQPPPKSEMIK